MFFVSRIFFSLPDDKRSASIEVFETETLAKKRWHSIIAADIDKTTISFEMVQIVRENGICIASEIIDHRFPVEEA